MPGNGQPKGRLYIDLMNSKTRIGDHVGKQFAQCLPALSPRISDGIRGQHSSQILLKRKGDGVVEG